ncbi:peptidylprolyl isomerase [Flavobacterium sp. SUN052]|uniref:peptidylprolyl isomerase n=1 Tax=Flavobacterium sp. SUN052 TaxID=3002441 RepID=UPI00237DE891|nr:peptidylprolyl isomerase [Flavobacterium sp. SUN052]MEC4005326.1 peptidylprolyl isomerase [Flavobacterium sp. SUN052]
MKLKFVMLFLFGLTIVTAQTKKIKSKKVATVETKSNSTDGIFAEFETTKGKILVQLEYKKTPVTVANFVSLAEGTNPQVAEKFKGKKFFDGLKFHRVIANFMIQGGDPDGNGSGGPGYAFKDEFTDAKFDKAGILAMANSGPKTNGSQFFITHKETSWLNGKHTIFGYVITGQDVVNAIAQNDVITKVTITRKGSDAKKFDAPKIFANYFENKAADEQKEAAERAAKNAVALKEFENGNTTASGLKYIVIKEGTGAQPTATSNVKVHYTGMFLDGKVFDSSVQRGEPIDFGLNQVIKGWTEGVQLMKEGAKYKFFIPYNLAYGEQGAGGVIPPKTDLIFEVELLKINN